MERSRVIGFSLNAICLRHGVQNSVYFEINTGLSVETVLKLFIAAITYIYSIYAYR